jgi:Cu/Ag efflux protein CusF
MQLSLLASFIASAAVLSACGGAANTTNTSTANNTASAKTPAFFSSFDPATVVAIDPKAGKITVKRKTGDEQKELDFGEVMK